MIQAVQDIALSLSKGIADFKCSMEAISTETHTDTFESLQSDDEYFDLPKSVVDCGDVEKQNALLLARVGGLEQVVGGKIGNNQQNTLACELTDGGCGIIAWL